MVLLVALFRNKMEKFVAICFGILVVLFVGNYMHHVETKVMAIEYCFDVDGNYYVCSERE